MSEKIKVWPPYRDVVIIGYTGGPEGLDWRKIKLPKFPRTSVTRRETNQEPPSPPKP